MRVNAELENSMYPKSAQDDFTMLRQREIVLGKSVR